MAAGQYVVVSGDTLSGIAARFDTTTAELQRLNPSITNPDMIAVGQVLRIPQSNSGDARSTPDLLCCRDLCFLCSHHDTLLPK